MATKVKIQANIIASNDGNETTFENKAGYRDEYNYSDLGDDQFITKRALSGAIPSAIEVPIPSVPFDYDTGITDRIVKAQVYLKPTATSYQLWYPKVIFDKDTGIITVDEIDTSADSYVLVVG